MIDKSTFVTVKGCINTKGEEIFIRALLDLHVIIISLIWIVHIKQIAHSHFIISFATFITVFSCKYLTNVFNNKSSCRYKLLAKKTPHCCLNLSSFKISWFSDSFYQCSPFMSVIWFHQKVLAQILITLASWMAFIESESSVITLNCSWLNSYDMSVIMDLHFVGRID